MNPRFHFAARIAIGVAAPVATAPSTAQIAPVPPIVADAVRAMKAYDPAAAVHIRTFDTLDFDVYSNQKWDRLSESHAPDVVVHYPDGHITRGLAAHLAELKPQFVFAPDTRVVSHPIKVGNGDWTAVVGQATGTFTRPMQTGPGKFAQPTGKRFNFQMVTIGHWNKDGVLDEEWLFWDNAALAKQIGLM